jgi:hypothetical protein
MARAAYISANSEVVGGEEMLRAVSLSTALNVRGTPVHYGEFILLIKWRTHGIDPRHYPDCR